MSFQSIIGHEAAISRLRAAIRNGRLAHAYIFAGPEGLGKTLAARAFAKAILCETRGDDACGACVACRKFEHGNHEGFETIGPEGAGQLVKIEALRQLQHRLAFASAGGEHRVVVIEPAERMRAETANAFLKTLEEPPPGVVMILITAQPAALLDTILSRCQMVRFAPVARDDIGQMLTGQHSAPPDAAALAAAMSDGSPGHAIGLLDGTLAAERDEIFDALLGLTLENTPGLVAELMQRIKKGGSALSGQRVTARGLLALMLYVFRDILAVTLAGDTYPLYSADRREAMHDAAVVFDSRGVLAILDLLIGGIELIGRNVNLEMLLDDLVGRIAQIKAGEPALGTPPAWKGSAT